MSRDTRRGLRSGALMLMLSMLVGCGGTKPTGKITGKVTVNGKAVTGGAVTFYSEAGRVDSGAIQPDGQYTIAQAPVGDVTATVVSAQPRASRPPAGKTPGGRDKPASHPSASETASDVKPVAVPRK